TRIAVLAVGRAAGAAGLPYQRRHTDHQVAVAAQFSASAPDPRTIIEAVTYGWFYLAAVPGDRLNVVLITTAGAVPGDKERRRRWWLEGLAQTIAIRAALHGQPIPRSLSVYDARSSHARPPAGKDWLAIGDARLAPDPLSGQGILWAIEDAICAARA